jgi:hypothetical protein
MERTIKSDIGRTEFLSSWVSSFTTVEEFITDAPAMIHLLPEKRTEELTRVYNLATESKKKKPAKNK